MKIMKSILFSLLVSFISAGHVASDPMQEVRYGRLIEYGKQAQKAGKQEIAVRAFSKAIRLSPRNPHAHLLLVKSFASQGLQRRAEAYLHSLIKEPEQRVNVATFQAALAKFEKQRPFVFSGSFVIKPSSNINNVSSQRFFDTLLGRFDINNGGNEQFGVGVELGGKLVHRTPLQDGRSIELSGTISRGFFERSDLRYWRANIGADIKQIGPQKDWRIGIFADRKAYTDVSNSSGELLSYGLRGNFRKSLSASRHISIHGSAEQRNYINAETLSGPIFSLGTSVRSVHARGRTSFYGINFERRRTELDYHRYWGIGVRAGYEANVTQNLRMGLNSAFTIREYDANFASVDFARHDRILKFGVSAINKKIDVFGATPKLSCSIERQKSNIALYSKNTTECQIGWFYSF